jgi:hypothetical protein
VDVTTVGGWVGRIGGDDEADDDGGATGALPAAWVARWGCPGEGAAGARLGNGSGMRQRRQRGVLAVDVVNYW